MTPEIEKTAYEWIQRRVSEGFESREEIIEWVTEGIEDEYSIQDAEASIRVITDILLAKHYTEQETWEGVTDCDRIDAAFHDLEEQGIVARQHFACCQNCGHAEIGDEIEAFAEHAKPIGYTFYHMQDTESACESGVLYLAYGTVGGGDDEALVIGKTIRQTLEQHGLTVRWDGSLKKRICITGIQWKKRRVNELTGA